MRFVFGIALSMFLSACAQPQGNDRLAEKARIESDADRKSQDSRATQMEQDLARVQNFYQAVRGIYEGNLTVSTGRRYRVRLNIHPNIERFEGDRIRTPDEISYDMKNLAFDVAENTIAKMSDGSDLSFGCSFSGIRAGVERGFFTLEGGCARSFMINLVPTSSPVISDMARLETVSRSVATELLASDSATAMQMQVEMRSVNLPEATVFMVKRVR